jgi:ribose 5-phosphate isomerase B
MKIALSTDHTGLEQVRQLKAWLESKGNVCIDYGPTTFIQDDDYPDYIFPAAESIASGECELGIIMGGSGQGEAMVANRVKGIRCTVYYGPAKPIGAIDAEGTEATDEFEILRLSRQHNDANMLSLAARFLTTEDIETAVKIWLETPYTGIERHARRIAKFDSRS